jgi:uncharacterized membrane protein
MRHALVLAALLWPVTLTAALVDQFHHQPSMASAVVYLAASRVCHQKPERSFSTAGHQWPVCGRCAGLYLAAPIGAIAGLRGRRPLPARRARVWLIAAAIPSAVTLLVEWSAWFPVTSAARMAAALPLGAAIAWILVRTAPGLDRSDQVN